MAAVTLAMMAAAAEASSAATSNPANAAADAALVALAKAVYGDGAAYVVALPSTKLCDQCLRPGGRCCAHCRSAQYCSKACQERAWSQHKRECTRLCAPVPDNVNTNPRKQVGRMHARVFWFTHVDAVCACALCNAAQSACLAAVQKFLDKDVLSDQLAVAQLAQLEEARLRLRRAWPGDPEQSDEAAVSTVLAEILLRESIAFEQQGRLREALQRRRAAARILVRSVQRLPATQAAAGDKCLALLTKAQRFLTVSLLSLRRLQEALEVVQAAAANCVKVNVNDAWAVALVLLMYGKIVGDLQLTSGRVRLADAMTPVRLALAALEEHPPGSTAASFADDARSELQSLQVQHNLLMKQCLPAGATDRGRPEQKHDDGGGFVGGNHADNVYLQALARVAQAMQLAHADARPAEAEKEFFEAERLLRTVIDWKSADGQPHVRASASANTLAAATVCLAQMRLEHYSRAPPDPQQIAAWVKDNDRAEQLLRTYPPLLDVSQHTLSSLVRYSARTLALLGRYHEALERLRKMLREYEERPFAGGSGLLAAHVGDIFTMAAAFAAASGQEAAARLAWSPDAALAFVRRLRPEAAVEDLRATLHKAHGDFSALASFSRGVQRSPEGVVDGARAGVVHPSGKLRTQS